MRRQPVQLGWVNVGHLAAAGTFQIHRRSALFGYGINHAPTLMTLRQQTSAKYYALSAIYPQFKRQTVFDRQVAKRLDCDVFQHRFRKTMSL